jgi:plasmid stabilization system protein ParE
VIIAKILGDAESDLDAAFLYYESARRGLGIEMLTEFRNGIEQILRHPEAWQSMDERYRRYRLHRFPYGIVYRMGENKDEILVVAIMHLSQKPGSWRPRDI